MYGRPDTLIGFLEVVTGSQFGGSLGEAVRDPGAAVGALGRVLDGQFGPFALLVPIAAAVTIARRPQYAVLTIPTAILTGAFALIYDNAMIERYWAMPLLMAWTWLAVAADAVLGALMGVGRADGTSARRRSVDPRLAALASVAAAVVLLVPTIAELPGRWRAVDASNETVGRAWLESALAALPAGCGRRVVVELLDAAMVRAIRATVPAEPASFSAPGQPVSPSIATLVSNIERLQLDFDRHIPVHTPNPDRTLPRQT